MLLHLYGFQSVPACMDVCMCFFAGVTALVGVISGMTMQLALLHDLTCLLAVPLLLAYMAYTKLYAVQLHYTLLMWRLMRGNRSVEHKGMWQLALPGKQGTVNDPDWLWKRSVVRNPVLAICRDALAVLRRQYGFEASPRKRKQTHCCHHEDQDGLALEQVRMGCCIQQPCWSEQMCKASCVLQMIVGVLLFTPLLFLLPTTCVYYVLFLLLHVSVMLARWGLQTLSNLLHSNPAYFLWCWMFKPGMVPGIPLCAFDSWHAICF